LHVQGSGLYAEHAWYLALQVVAHGLWVLLRRTLQLSSDFEPAGQYGHASAGLRPGWLAPYNDLSDIQWREFRVALPQLAAALAAFAALSQAVRLCKCDRGLPWCQGHALECSSDTLLLRRRNRRAVAGGYAPASRCPAPSYVCPLTATLCVTLTCESA
jgi:hypothetical protein